MTVDPLSGPPTSRLSFNGMTAPPEAQRDVIAIRVEESLDAISMLTVEMANWNPDTLQHTWSDAAITGIGTMVEVSLGYLDRATPVFSGEIVAVEPVWSIDRAPTVVLRALDRGHRLTRGTTTASYSKVKDSDIAARIATRNGLRAQAQDTKVLHDHVFQANQSDLEFLRARAARLGWEVFVRDRVLHFREPKHTAAPARTLRVGEDLEEFAPRLSAGAQVGKAIVRGWDVRTKKVISATAQSRAVAPMGGRRTGGAAADAAFGAASTTAVEVPVSGAQEAGQVATGRTLAATLRHIEGEAAGPGAPDLRTGTTVRIDGAGTRFSGSYYIAQVVHLLDAGRFRTSLRVRRTAA